MKIELSTSGHEIIVLDGKPLSSRQDPIRESQKWLKKIEPILFDLDTLIILGLGSGYKLTEVFLNYPRIKVIAIESNAELIAQVKKIQPKINLVNTQFVCHRSMAELKKSDPLIEGVKKNYTTVSNNFLVRRDEIVSQDVLDFLNGRTLEGFSWVCQHRGLNNVSIPALKQGGLLSVKELRSEIQREDIDISFRRSLALLNEMIK